MGMQGTRTTNIPAASAVDELLGNTTLEGVASTVRIPITALAAQIAATGSFVAGNTIYCLTQPEMEAFSPDTDNFGALVLADQTRPGGAASNNGYWSYDLAGTAWEFGRGFHQTFGEFKGFGGTANAQTADLDPWIDPSAPLVYFAFPDEANTGPMTLNGVEVVNKAGNALAASEWTPDGVMFVARGGAYRLLTDAGAAASAAQSASNAADTLAELRETALGNFADDVAAETAAGTPVEGQFYWNTTSKVFRYYDGLAWQAFPYATAAPGSIGPTEIETGYSLAIQVDTIAALKARSVTGLATGDLVAVRGFDSAGDGCGGVFRYMSGPVPADTLDGVLMTSDNSGYWVRTDAFMGPIHTRWVGIKPESDPDNSSFDKDGHATGNAARWNAMMAFAGTEILQALTSDKANFVRQAVIVDPGIHDFSGATLLKPQGVGLMGTSRGAAALRANITGGVFLQAGDAGDRFSDPTLESAFDDLHFLSIINFASSTGGTGVAYDNTLRAANLSHLFIKNFGTNLDVDAFGINMSNLWLQSGHSKNLNVGPSVNSLGIDLSRFDDQSGVGGDNVRVDSGGTGLSIAISRCDIQRSYGRGLALEDCSNISIVDSFFEGNCRNDDSQPDIIIGGATARNIYINNNYFTGAGRFSATTAVAIALRSNLTANAFAQVTNNQQINSADGTFAHFLRVDANVAMEVAYWNNRKVAANSIPGNVVKKGLAAGTW